MIFDEIAFRSLLAKGEEIEYVAHVHPFKVYPQLFKVLIVGVLLPAVGYYLLPPFKIVWFSWAALGGLLFFYRILQWYLDAWVVTNQGVIDQEWNSFFDRQSTRIEYTGIEGITSEIRGFWPTVMRYGNIQIEHMSGQPVSLENVASPRKLEKIIQKNQQSFLRRQNFTDHTKLRDLLTGLIRTVNK